MITGGVNLPFRILGQGITLICDFLVSHVGCWDDFAFNPVEFRIALMAIRPIVCHLLQYEGRCVRDVYKSHNGVT